MSMVSKGEHEAEWKIFGSSSFSSSRYPGRKAVSAVIQPPGLSPSCHWVRSYPQQMTWYHNRSDSVSAIAAFGTSQPPSLQLILGADVERHSQTCYSTGHLSWISSYLYMARRHCSLSGAEDNGNGVVRQQIPTSLMQHNMKPFQNAKLAVRSGPTPAAWRECLL